MVKVGKVKFDNNYWAKKSDGTWSNTWTFYDVLLHDFGSYNVAYICSVGKISLISIDGGLTFTESELKVDEFPVSNPVYVNIDETGIERLVIEKLNPLGKDKIITWEEPMHEIA